MAETQGEEFVRRYMKTYADRDYDALNTYRHADWTLDWPQTGERIRGSANDQAINENYPGGIPAVGVKRVVGSEDRWVATPAYTVQRVTGHGDFWWGDGTVDYPDGSTWHIAFLVELRDGKVHRETHFFAPRLDPPAWRAAWVEPISDPSRV